MTDNYDQLALSWVRKEINNTLEQARQGLETFADDNHDQTQIQFCINCLRPISLLARSSSRGLTPLLTVFKY